jgi:hypothetical protein
MICVFAAALLSIGCGKHEEPVAPKPPEVPKPAVVTPAAEQPAVEAPKPVEKSTIEKATEVVANAQPMIDKARKLIEQKDYAGALQALNELTAQKVELTGDQQKAVDDLKATAQKQMQAAAAEKVGGEATKAIGNLLGK